MLPDYAGGSDYHVRRRGLQAYALKCFEIAIDTLGRPDSVLDVGCGEGALIEWCRGTGIEAVGVDLAVPVHDSRGWLYHHDLRASLDLGVAFDWVLCWEVAEHLSEAVADTLCETLARHVAKPSGRLLFTAAAPGQRGPGHINTKHKRFWREKLEACGLTWQINESEALSKRWLSEVPRAPWYGKNLMVHAWV